MPVFNVGDRVSVRQVGVGSVVAVRRIDAFGGGREFYEITPDRQTSTLFIPTDLDPAERGLRKVMSATQAREVLEVLSAPTTLLSDPEWRRTLKERQKASETADQAALVRDMQARVTYRRLTAQEKVYLEKAVEVLVDEMAEALGVAREEVKQSVERTLARTVEREKEKAAAAAR